MKIKTEVIGILEQGEIEGNKFFLPDIQLDRKLYLEVNKILGLAGGKWNRSAKAHLFSEDIGDLLDTFILSGEITNTKKELQYFATPKAIVEQLIDLANLERGDSVLEPSAGRGAIAFALAERGYMPTVCEIHEPFIEVLSSHINCVCLGDFLGWQTSDRRFYDKVIANPPFTRQQDIDHVNKMIDFCCGRVVSVMSASVLFRDNKKTAEFRKKIADLEGKFIELPMGSFKESGTMVSACIVIVDI